MPILRPNNKWRKQQGHPYRELLATITYSAARRTIVLYVDGVLCVHAQNQCRRMHRLQIQAEITCQGLGIYIWRPSRYNK